MMSGIVMICFLLIVKGVVLSYFGILVLFVGGVVVICV